MRDAPPRRPPQPRPGAGRRVPAMRRAAPPPASSARPRSRSAPERLPVVLPAACARIQPAWDYYKGMGPNEIEANLRNDTSWQRPTWPLGRLGGSTVQRRNSSRDPLGMPARYPAARAAQPATRSATAPPELRAALDVLGLDWPLDRDAAGPLQGTGQAAASRRQWRRPRRGGAAEGCEPRLQPVAPASRRGRSGHGSGRQRRRGRRRTRAEVRNSPHPGSLPPALS